MGPLSYTCTRFQGGGCATTTPSFKVPLNGSVPFTVSAWARIGSTEDQADILYQAGVFRFGTVGQQLYVQLDGFPELISDGIAHPITPTDWHYVACTFDGTYLSLYVDGMLDCRAGITGTPAGSGPAFILANNLQGLLNCVRVYDSALTATQVASAMFQPDPAQVYDACFDFSQWPPVDTSGNNWPVALSGNVAPQQVTNAVKLGNSAYCQPVRDGGVAPGGAGNDAYSIQAWVRVANASVQFMQDGLLPAGQAILVDQALDDSTGVALYLAYDPVQQLYRLASLRGDVTVAANSLISQGTIPFGQWVNVATTYDPTTTTLSLYINGQLDSSSAAFPALPPMSAPDLLIGGAVLAGQPASAWTLQGHIQRVDVWNIALSAAQVQQWTSGYPVQEPGIVAHYDLSGTLVRNEVSGAPVGLADLAVPAEQISASKSATAAARPQVEEASTVKQLPPDVIARLRASVDLTKVQGLERLLDEAAEQEIGPQAAHFVPAGELDAYRKRMKAEWAKAKQTILENPLDLPYLITYHQVDGEHVLMHHTPERSMVVFRAPLAAVDACTMWKIQLVWTVISGILSVVGVYAAMSSKVVDYINKNIIGNLRLMARLNQVMTVSATGLAVLNFLLVLQTYGVLWPVIRTALIAMSWWALGLCLAKLLARFLPAAWVATVASLVIAAAQVAIVLAQRPAGCGLLLAEAEDRPRLQPAMA